MTEILAAPAKLTLSLRLVGPPRPDGLHTIDAEMVSLDFGDELTVTPLPPDQPSEVSYRGAAEHVPTTADDLVTRALALVGRSARVEVVKRIPAGAGLGGGSSDAAAILRWAGFDDRERAAFELGADVAYCLVGGRARVTGIGEVVAPLPYEERVVTLLTPPVHCPTGAVYRAWDELHAAAPSTGGPPSLTGQPDPEPDSRPVPDLEPGGAQPGLGPNDLEAAALVVRPELARWRDELASATGCRPHLAGSGSTWFVAGAHPGPGRQVATTIPPPRT